MEEIKAEAKEAEEVKEAEGAFSRKGVQLL
jgi:hypothetical protein